MKTVKFLSIPLLIFTLGISVMSCKKVKDADLQQEAQTALVTNPDAINVQVAVAEQVATLTGTVKDDATKASVETVVTAVKNIKSVVNNIEIVPPAPDYTQLDAAIQSGLADALKDHSSVIAEVKDGVIKLTGEIQKKDLPTLMQKVSSLNPTSINNQLIIK